MIKLKKKVQKFRIWKMEYHYTNMVNNPKGGKLVSYKQTMKYHTPDKIFLLRINVASPKGFKM